MNDPSVLSNSEPLLKWEKVMCEFCGEPTGPCSKCESVPKEDRLAKVMTIGGQIRRLYDKNCYYKATNLWIAHTNYPVSASLMEKLIPIPGIDIITPDGPYSFIVEIARIFGEESVKKQIAINYRTFIKGKQALVATKKQVAANQEIVFPNGSKFIAHTTEEKQIAQDLRQMFEN